MTSPDIYIDISPAQEEPLTSQGLDIIQPPGNGWHAQFAFAVKIRDFDDLKKLKWGFNFGSLLEEVLERQRLFIESQHFPGELRKQPTEFRTLALRFVHEPERNSLRLYLLAKVQAHDRKSAFSLAIQTRQELESIFPYEYKLDPIDNRISFTQETGWNWVRQSSDVFSFLEIEKYEGVLSTGQERIFILGSWNDSMIGNEQVWRVLAGAKQRIFLNVIIRPVILQDYDVLALHNIAEYAEKIRKGSVNPALLPYIDAAVLNYRKMAESLRRPYLVRIHLVSPERIPEYIPRAIGSALTHTDKPSPSAPGFQIVLPKSDGELTNWQQLLLWIEPTAFSPDGYDVRFTRLRNLVDAQGALSLFRLPFPPEGGIPGVTFE